MRSIGPTYSWKASKMLLGTFNVPSLYVVNEKFSSWNSSRFLLKRLRCVLSLTKENQKYFETLKNCIERGFYDVCAHICNSLRHDAGLNQLLPYITQYFASVVGDELESESPTVTRKIQRLPQGRARYVRSPFSVRWKAPTLCFPTHLESSPYLQ